ncbi:MAG: TIGR01777 family oxidoreductase [Leptospiraceae bacterium]|nr:TIGR01777 family oxidoreductase [Leptospiraceae bacterium]
MATVEKENTIGIIGGTGLIGSELTKEFLRHSFRIKIFSRGNKLPPSLQGLSGVSLIQTEQVQAGDLEGLKYLFNLAGEKIIGRWSDVKKDLLWSSRVNSTRALVSELKKTEKKPEVLVNASAVGYYGMHPASSPVFTENSKCGEDFLSRLCFDWEKEAFEAEEFGVSVRLARIGIVLSNRGGALKEMLPAFRLFLGGPVGNGEQYMSWIHIEDIVRALHFIVNTEEKRGIYNLSAPHPVSNREFTETLARTLSRPNFFRVPNVTLKFLFGEVASILTQGQNVLPAALLNAGFQFRYNTLESALRNLLV